jgi:glutaconate CoA-transferase subunit B
MYRIVTDLGIFGFEEQSKAMQVVALHPGVTMEQVNDNTGFRVLDNPACTQTEPPTELELSVLRELDPQALYIA